MKKSILLGLLIAVVAVAAVVWVLIRDNRVDYAAKGTFYYWFPGLEMTSGRGGWSGADPIWCFKSDLWDSRPRDFRWKVWHKFRRRREWDVNQVKSLFNEAYDSVFASRNSEVAITWGYLYAVSTDPKVAAEVVNSYMSALSELELENLDKRRDVMAGTLAYSHYLSVKEQRNLETELGKEKDRQKHESLSASLEILKRKISAIESSIDVQKNIDNRTNTMFKVMKEAEIPSEPIGVLERKRMKQVKEWFDNLSNPQRP